MRGDEILMSSRPPIEVQHLFKIGKIGELELKNRIIMAPMLIGLSELDGTIGERFTRFYVERAEGGAALIAVGGICPDDRYRSHPGQPSLDGDKYIPGWKKFTNEIKERGAKVTVQLLHPGRYALSIITGRQPVAPSPIPSKFTGETPKELTIEEIIEIEEKFAEAAKRAKLAGFDGVELCASAGYLFSQFLSPATNKRSDKYGGPLENRMRFLIETVEKIKSVTGEKYPLIVRLSAEDYMPGGTTIEETKIVAKSLENVGVDAINITTGWHESPRPLITREVPPGGFIHLAEAIKKVISIPVIASNRIKYPQLANKVIKEGKADFVAIGRPLIVDPLWPQKAYEGRYNEIRPCIACGHCLESLFSGNAIECTVNPRAGKESEYNVERAERSKNILVIGGGPAGLEAALTASSRGHNVTLCEKTGDLGGQFRLAAIPPYKEELTELIKYYETMLRKLNVKIKLNTEITSDVARKLAHDVIIVATGSEPLIPNIPGVHQENVTTAHDVLSGKATYGNKIAIIGGGGVGLETADYLSEKGKDVIVIEMLGKVGLDMERTARWPLLKRLQAKNVKILTNTKAVAIEGNYVVAKCNEHKKRISADTIVLAVGAVPKNELYEKLKDDFKNVYAVGDCVKPQRVRQAIAAAFKTAIKI